MPNVAVIMGSRSDDEVMQGCTKTLEEIGVSYEVRVISAHRAPDRLREYVRSARDRGVQVVIAAAGGAAHLPGVVASLTTLPVIGIPLPSSDLKGIDALYSIVQMPPGVPVAAVSVGAWGARNAAYLAAQIIGLSDPTVREAYDAFRAKLAEA